MIPKSSVFVDGVVITLGEVPAYSRSTSVLHCVPRSLLLVWVGTTRIDCTTCPAGYFGVADSNGKHTSCQACAFGRHGNGQEGAQDNSVCVDCSKGKFSANQIRADKPCVLFRVHHTIRVNFSFAQKDNVNAISNSP